MLTVIKRLECYDCGINADLRRCTGESGMDLILCSDCISDRQNEDEQNEEDGE